MAPRLGVNRRRLAGNRRRFEGSPAHSMLSACRRESLPSPLQTGPDSERDTQGLWKRGTGLSAGHPTHCTARDWWVLQRSGSERSTASLRRPCL